MGVRVQQLKTAIEENTLQQAIEDEIVGITVDGESLRVSSAHSISPTASPEEQK